MIVASHSLHVTSDPQSGTRQTLAELETLFANAGKEVGQNQLASEELVPSRSMQTVEDVAHHQETPSQLAQSLWVQAPGIPFQDEEPQVDIDESVFPEAGTNWLHQCDYCGLVSTSFSSGLCHEQHSLQTCTPEWL